MFHLLPLQKEMQCPAQIQSFKNSTQVRELIWPKIYLVKNITDEQKQILQLKHNKCYIFKRYILRVTQNEHFSFRGTS